MTTDSAAAPPMTATSSMKTSGPVSTLSTSALRPLRADARLLVAHVRRLSLGAGDAFALPLGDELVEDRLVHLCLDVYLFFRRLRGGRGPAAGGGGRCCRGCRCGGRGGILGGLARDRKSVV